MKFRTTRIDLTEKFGITTNDGSTAWVDVPGGVTEGFLNAMQQVRGLDASGAQKDPQGRLGNLLVLEQVIAWNIDDDKGKVLPLVKAVADPDKRLAVLGQLPVELFSELASTMIGRPSLSKEAEDFSKASSEA